MPPIRLHVDHDLCEAHALCTEIAPEVFDLGDDDLAHCDESPPEALWPKVKSAASACPRQAITITET
ncbi:ferredoxin [Rhodococcus sp. O3]|uniref:ferredoxin n=1 Tax=Rhodococcus sp. O3 TaxID=3404919 RepID=UPI003B68311F